MCVTNVLGAQRLLKLVRIGDVAVRGLAWRECRMSGLRNCSIVIITRPETGLITNSHLAQQEMSPIHNSDLCRIHDCLNGQFKSKIQMLIAKLVVAKISS